MGEAAADARYLRGRRYDSSGILYFMYDNDGAGMTMLCYDAKPACRRERLSAIFLLLAFSRRRRVGDANTLHIMRDEIFSHDAGFSAR